MEEITQVEDKGNLRDQIQKLYDERVNRFKARLSAMYPQHSTGSSVGFSSFHSTTMMEVVAYLDTQSQLRLESVNQYFHKLIRISHNDVALTARTGWFSAIHLSSYLHRIRLYGEPKEKELKDFTMMLQNDGFTELSTLELYHIGEWAMLEIVEALAQRVQRALRLGVQDSSTGLRLVIQEIDFTPFFAGKLAEHINATLFHVLTGIRFVVQNVEGVIVILQKTRLMSCQRLTEVDFSSLPILRYGFELLVRSLWMDDAEVKTEAPRVSKLLLANMGLSDPCLVPLADVGASCLLSNLEYLDLSANCLSCDGMLVLTDLLAPYLCPNLRSLLLSNNPDLGGDPVDAFFSKLAEGVCPLLEDLLLNHCGLSAANLASLATFLASPFAENLKVLDVGNNPAATASLPQLLASLTTGPAHSLHVLNVEGLSFSLPIEHAFTQWLRHAQLAHLRSLCLSNTQLRQQSLFLVLQALSFSSVRDLDLIDVSSNLLERFDPALWETLVYAGRKRRQHVFSVRRFELNHNPLSNSDLDWLCRYIALFCRVDLLQEASFEDNTISSKGVMTFLNVFASCDHGGLEKLSITTLSLRSIGHDLYAWLCSPAASNLQRLALTNCNLCRMDWMYLIKAFEESKYCKKIQYLKLSGNYDIDDEFLVQFVRIYSIEDILPYLYQLDLSYTNITKIGCYELLDFFKTHDFYSLRRLNLSYTKLSDHRVDILFDEFRRVFKGGCSF